MLEYTLGWRYILHSTSTTSHRKQRFDIGNSHQLSKNRLEISCTTVLCTNYNTPASCPVLNMNNPKLPGIIQSLEFAQETDVGEPPNVKLLSLAHARESRISRCRMEHFFLRDLCVKSDRLSSNNDHSIFDCRTGQQGSRQNFRGQPQPQRQNKRVVLAGRVVVLRVDQGNTQFGIRLTACHQLRFITCVYTPYVNGNAFALAEYHAVIVAGTNMFPKPYVGASNSEIVALWLIPVCREVSIPLPSNIYQYRLNKYRFSVSQHFVGQTFHPQNVQSCFDLSAQLPFCRNNQSEQRRVSGPEKSKATPELFERLLLI